VIAISDQVRAHLLKDFGLPASQVALIYNGSTSKGSSRRRRREGPGARGVGPGPFQKVVGISGASRRQGSKYLVEAAARIAADRSDVRFLLIGDGKEEAALRRLIRQKGLEDVFRLARSVDDTAVACARWMCSSCLRCRKGWGFRYWRPWRAACPAWRRPSAASRPRSRITSRAFSSSGRPGGPGPRDRQVIG